MAANEDICPDLTFFPEIKNVFQFWILICFLFFVVGFEGWLVCDEITAHLREDKVPPNASVYRPMVTGLRLSVWEALC